MAKQKTDKSCYQSVYGGDWITARQKLAEIVCERFANKQNQTLSPRFWSNPGPWAKYFLQQMAQASKLLEQFSSDAIFSALKSNSGKYIYSLGSQRLPDMIGVEQLKMDNREKRIVDAVIPEVVDINIKPTTYKRTGKSLRERLR